MQFFIFIIQKDPQKASQVSKVIKVIGSADSCSKMYQYVQVRRNITLFFMLL